MGLARPARPARTGAALTQVSGGKVFLTEVDTGLDAYAIVLSDKPLRQAEALSLWQDAVDDA